MALPVILVDSSSGSDTTASGAGPSSSLSGTTNASTDGAGTTVTLPAGTDLSGVAIDGSHTIFLNDATAGARNHGKITGSAGSGGATPTVTVANAFGLSLVNKSWAIGGKRASIGGTTSKKLFDNNTAAGDAMPGWIIEMQSGHTETIAAAFDCRRAGDLTDGPITLRGASGGTRPALTFSNNGIAIDPRGAYINFKFFELKNSNATKTASIGINPNSGGAGFDGILMDDVKIADASNKFWKGVQHQSNSMRIINCEIGNTANYGIDGVGVGAGTLMIRANYIHDTGSDSIRAAGAASTWRGLHIADNLIVNSVGHGIVLDTNMPATSSGPFAIERNTINACAASKDAIRIVTDFVGIINLSIINNILSNNGGYGINWVFGPTLAKLQAYGPHIDANDCYNNSSGAYSVAGYATNDPALDPQFTNAAGADYSIGVNLKALGFPSGLMGKGSSTTSYFDIGAAQRQEASSGGGSAVAIFG